jgi:hypothetical protein
MIASRPLNPTRTIPAPPDRRCEENFAVIRKNPDLRKKEIAVLSGSPQYPTVSTRLLAPVDERVAPVFCLLLLTAACVLASLAFAWTTPFAAFAALAGAMLPLSAALPVVVAVWIINQAIGFVVLGYPVEMNTLLWGLGIGVAARSRPWCWCRCRGFRRRSVASQGSLSA